MSQENVEVVRRVYAALNDAYESGDFMAALKALSHPDIVIRMSGMFPETGEYHGHDGAQDFAAGQAEAFEEMSVEPLDFRCALDEKQPHAPFPARRAGYLPSGGGPTDQGGLNEGQG